MTGLFVKNKISNVHFNDAVKGVFRRFWLGLKKISDILINAAHNWYQGRGLVNATLFPIQAANFVQNNSIPLFTNLRQHHNVFNQAICGTDFDRFPLPYPYTTDVLTDSYNFHREVWLTTPIYLFNHHYFFREKPEDQFYPGITEYLTPVTDLTPLFKNAQLMFSPQATAITYAGALVPRQEQSRLLNAFDGDPAKPGKTSQVSKTVYAVVQMDHSKNPGMWLNTIRYYLYRQDDSSYVKMQNVMCYTNEFLRYDTLTCDSYGIRRSRPNFFILLPCYPPMQDAASGRLLFPAFLASSDVRGIKPGYSLDGRGSYQAQFTIAMYRPLDELLIAPTPIGVVPQ
jgi:hypothetical protein